jgi:hypothetical protein
MSQRCHTNQCPVGVATQDPKRARALNVPDKTERAWRYQDGTVRDAMQLMGSLGVSEPAGVQPWMLMRRVDEVNARSYAELYDWLKPGELLDDPPVSWADDWERAHPDRFAA